MSMMREMRSRLAAEKKQQQADAVEFCIPTLVLDTSAKRGPRPIFGDAIEKGRRGEIGMAELANVAPPVM
jgi:hypothetical protein